jgi:HTH-type transcriptional regulator/antitoxin HigA
MDIRPIKTERDYIEAMRAIEALLERNLPDGSADLDRLDVLSTLVERYEEEHYAISLPDPIEAISIRMDELSLNQRALAYAADVPESKVSEVLSRKRPLSLGMIRAFSRALGLPEAVLVQEYPLAALA